MSISVLMAFIRYNADLLLRYKKITVFSGLRVMGILDDAMQGRVALLHLFDGRFMVHAA